jgi:multiple antibiotic resistance protein
MHGSQRLARKRTPALTTMPRAWFAALMAGACILIGADFAWAADAAAAELPAKHLPAAQTFTILFLMLGPFKVVGPFLKVTQAADERLVRRIALRATLFAAAALLVAAFLGEFFLSSYGIPLPVLALSAGIILFLVALRTILEQFEHPEPAHNDATVQAAPPSPTVALAPLAFPTIVTPYGIAALVVFLAVSQSVEGRLIVGGIVVAIMALNLLVMLLARRLRRVLALVLPILGAVLGVIQVALGLQIINNSLHTLGVL